MPPRSSASPSLALLAISASLMAPQFSAASGGAPLASAHSTCLLRAYATPPGSAVLRVSVLCRMVLRWPSVPIIEPCLIISCSVYWCRSLRGPQPVALRCLDVRRPTCRHSLSCFPRVFVFRRRDVCSGCGFTSPFAAFIGCFAQ